MINLAPIFEDSIDSLDNGAEFLQIKSLPISVFMMQKDVINHYKYAVRHYFDLTLQESFLQNSSLGSPYDKWMKFLNDDFDMLFFSIKTLVCFSSRLFHESELRRRIEIGDFGTLKMDSNRYTQVICDFKYQEKSLGFHVDIGESLIVNEFLPEGIFLDGRRTSVKTSKVDISNRKVLKQIARKAEAEILALEKIHREYSEKCRSFCMKVNVLDDYENLHQSYWV